MDPFDLNVDVAIIHDRDDEDDDDDDEKTGGKSIMKMTKRKVSYEDIEVEGFGDDEHKSEKQEQTFLPLEGGLAGLISNLSGVRIYQITFGRTVSSIFPFVHLFRVRTAQTLGLSSVSNNISFR